MEEVTVVDLIEIANHFVLNAPPGEFMEVVTDIRGLLADQESIINDTAPATFRQYNTDQMIQVQNGDHLALVTKQGEVKAGEYLDPRAGQVFSFDHIRQKVTSSRSMPVMDAALEPTRSAIDAAFDKYSKEFYPNGTSAVYAKNDQIILCLASSKFNPNNFWNGRWRSVWTCKISGANVTLQGRLRICVHYYEDGNVQFNADINKNVSCSGGNPQATAENVIKAIRKEESTYQQNIDSSYHTMGDTTFKALRRVLPITRMKIDWNKIRNMKMGAQSDK